MHLIIQYLYNLESYQWKANPSYVFANKEHLIEKNTRTFQDIGVNNGYTCASKTHCIRNIKNLFKVDRVTSCSAKQIVNHYVSCTK